MSDVIEEFYEKPEEKDPEEKDPEEKDPEEKDPEEEEEEEEEQDELEKDFAKFSKSKSQNNPENKKENEGLFESELDPDDDFKVTIFLSLMFALLDGFHVFIYGFISKYKITKEDIGLDETDREGLEMYFRTKEVADKINKLPTWLIGVIHTEYLYFMKYQDFNQKMKEQEEKEQEEETEEVEYEDVTEEEKKKTLAKKKAAKKRAVKKKAAKKKAVKKDPEEKPNDLMEAV